MTIAIERYPFFQRSTLFMFSQKTLIYSISCFRCQTLFVFCQRTLANSYEAFASLLSHAPLCLCSYTEPWSTAVEHSRFFFFFFPTSNLVRVLSESFDIPICSSRFSTFFDTPQLKSSLFLSFTLFKYCDRAPWHKVVAHLSSSYYTNPKVRQVCFVG